MCLPPIIYQPPTTLPGSTVIPIISTNPLTTQHFPSHAQIQTSHKSSLEATSPIHFPQVLSMCHKSHPISLQVLPMYHKSHPVKHLGHIFDCCLSFTKDVCKKGKFVACVNNIVTEFGFAHPRCKAKMVKTYGTSFYGSYLWDLFGPDCETHFTTWNIAMRIILVLQNTIHRRFVDQLSGLNNIHHILKCCFINFMQSLSNSNNNKLVHLYNICRKNKQSPSGPNITRIACEYNVKSCDIQQCNMLTQMNKIYVEKSKDLDNDQ